MSLGMKFYERPEFVELNRMWRKKLARASSGFSDIEDENENLYQHDRRTQSFENRDLVLDFFLTIDEWLNEAEIPDKHRRVLEMYTSGEYLTEISAKVNMSYAWVRLIIDRYESIIFD